MKQYNYVFRNIKFLRKNYRISQSALAEKVGIGKSYLSMIESGKRNISLGVLFDIAAALGVHPQALLEDDERDIFAHSLKWLGEHDRSLEKYRESMKERQEELRGLIEKMKIRLGMLDSKENQTENK